MSEDRIQISDLMLRAIIGVNDWERVERQDVLLNITLFGDLRAAGDSDQIDDTINYRTVTKQIIQHVESSKRFTVEALAADVARICLQANGVTRARVRVEKPGALRFAHSVGVEIERTAADFA
ncbi:MAG: dihydroneopterin aldolase [Anaerolineales bacterium]